MMTEKEVIKTVSYRQSEILENIVHLYAPSGIDVDVTYSKGYLYKGCPNCQPKVKYDIEPQTADTIKADCRKLPLKDGSCNSVMFDPPFLGAKGKSIATATKGNIMLRRFSCYPTEQELFAFYKESIAEIYRILADGGIAIIKCQDKVSSGMQYLTHVFFIEEGEKLGLYCEDLFVLVAKNRVLSPKHNRQKHARKYHAYFLVFRKNNKKLDRIRRDMNATIY